MARRSYPAIPRASINDDVRAITEILEIGLGIKGQTLDKFLTWNDLIDKNLVQILPDKIGSKGITESAIDNTIPVIEPPDLSTPPAPTGLAVYDGIRSISLAWDDPATLYTNHAFTEVWRHDSDNIANAVLVSRVTGLSYTDELQSVSTQQYYWIRFVSDADVVGPFNSATGTAGATVGVITAFLTGTVGFANLESTLSSTITQNTTDVSSLKGQYSVKIDANGFVNGFGLYNQGPNDNGFMVRADKFAISSPSLSGNVRYPFLVGFYNGQWRAIVDGNLMTDTLTVGSVSGSLQSSNWNGSSVGWKIDAAGDVTFNNGTFRGNVTAATITSSNISGSTITGSTFQTAASGRRAVLTSNTNDLRFYDASNNSLAWIGEAVIDLLGTKTTSAFFGDARILDYGIIAQGAIAAALFNTNTGPIGVYASATVNPVGIGVEAQGARIGVKGTGSSGTGIEGNGPTGVRGNGNYGGVGVWGYLSTTVGTAVYGNGGNIGVGSAGANTAFYGWNGDGVLVSGTWSPFTGSHYGLLDKNTTAEPGDILVDDTIVGNSTLIDCIAINLVSNASNQVAIGVFRRRNSLPDSLSNPDEVPAISKPAPLSTIPEADYTNLKNQYDLIDINAIGEGCINVCDFNGNITKGDLLITCPVVGKAAKQADDIVRSYTVARARESVTWANESGATKQIACIYLCG